MRIIFYEDIKGRTDVYVDLITVGSRELDRRLQVGASTLFIQGCDERGTKGVGVLAEASVLCGEGVGKAFSRKILV